MSKTGYFRWDIWEADLSQFKLENHFVVIVSNFKNNTKSKSVKCCLITSKLKEMSSRVAITLLKDSQIACETIITINKENLLYKFSKVDDLVMQLEIEKALEAQFQLSSNFINNDIELLESYLHEGVRKVDNKSKLEKLRNEIYDLAVKGELQETIIVCNMLIESANVSNVNNKNEYLWYSYYHRSVMFSKLQQYQLALSDAKESLRFCGSLREELNNRYCWSCWSISKCYEELNNTDGAINIYKSLSKYYKKVGKSHMRATMLHNIAKVNKNIKQMKTIIKYVECSNFIENETHLTKEALLSDMQQDLNNLLMQ